MCSGEMIDPVNPQVIGDRPHLLSYIEEEDCNDHAALVHPHSY